MAGNLYSSGRGSHDPSERRDNLPCKSNQGNQALEGVSIKWQTDREPVTITNIFYPPASSHSISSLEQKEVHLQPKIMN